jgi:hypothetical protein
LIALLHTEVQEWLRLHEHSDPAKLLLKGESVGDVPLPVLVDQLISRRKAKEKLPTWYTREGVLFPPPLSLEQASSELTGSFKARLVQGNALADLTGGCGVDAYFLSHSFKEVHYVEQQEPLAEIARHNFPLLGKAHIQVHHSTAQAFLEEFAKPLDLIYLDPARRKEGAKVFFLADCEPDVAALIPLMLERAAQVLIKTSPVLDISAALHDLPGTTGVWVVAVDNEVKEVLYLVEREANTPPRIHAIHLYKGKEERFAFTQEEEGSATARFSLPKEYLFEPNAAVLKAGAFKSIGLAYGLEKLHPHTHLYTADHPVGDFPGRRFRIVSQLRVDKKAVKAMLPEGKANLSIRNFPMKTEDLRKKLQLKEGGPHYLFATTLMDGSRQLLVCEKA